MRPREVYHIAILADLAVIDDDAAGQVRHKKGFKTATREEIAGDVADATVISDYQETLPR